MREDLEPSAPPLEGEFITVTINLTHEQAGDLAGLLKAFANMNN